MNTNEDVFRKCHLFSKEDILKSIEKFIEYEKIVQGEIARSEG